MKLAEALAKVRPTLDTPHPMIVVRTADGDHRAEYWYGWCLSVHQRPYMDHGVRVTDPFSGEVTA